MILNIEFVYFLYLEKKQERIANKTNARFHSLTIKNRKLSFTNGMKAANKNLCYTGVIEDKIISL